MGRLFVRFGAPLLACTLAVALLGAPAAQAATPAANSASFVGTYTFHILGTSPLVVDVQVNADGSATVQSNGGTWFNRRRNFTLTFSFNASLTEVFTAKQTTKGLASKAHPGSLVINGTPSGTWYAIKTS